jgi:glutathione S-transferase
VSAPVSGYATRVRYIAAKKVLGPDVIQTRPPTDFGGLKSEQYLAFSPLGKMPALFIRDPQVGGPDVLFKSRGIVDYVIDRFSDVGPSFYCKHTGAPGGWKSFSDNLRQLHRCFAASHVRNIRENFLLSAENLLDKIKSTLSLTYDSGVDRAAKVLEMSSAFDAIEVALDATGPYVAGSEGSGGCCPSRRIKGHRTPARLRGLGTSAD